MTEMRSQDNRWGARPADNDLDIEFVEKNTHCAEFFFGNREINVSWHAVDQFRERSDTYIPNKLTAVVLMKQAFDETRPHDGRKTGTTFWENDGWRFITRDAGLKSVLVTCYQI